MLRFSECTFTRVIFYLTFEKTKLYKCGCGDKERPRDIIWRKTAIFFIGKVIFLRKLLDMDYLTQKRYITALKSIKYDTE